MDRRPTEKCYLCIDLKSFYASVECIDRGKDPFTTKLVVADPERSQTTICLAVSPALKALGMPGRCRVFEIPESIIKSDDFIMAPPRMKRYMEVSTQIYSLYLRYVSPQDIHVYSIDECFIDATPYLSLYHMDAIAFAKTLTKTVFDEIGVCATVGIGTNLFLAKVALDITAKHDHDGIGILDETTFKQKIWFHQPITDIWNIGSGIARRLAKYGVYDLAGICAMEEETLYKEFGVNAEFLIDHAWGQEPCTIEQIHSYVPEGHSLVNGQVLPCDYTLEETRMVMHEMLDASVLELVQKGLVAESISLSIGYARPKMSTNANAESPSANVETTHANSQRPIANVEDTHANPEASSTATKAPKTYATQTSFDPEDSLAYNSYNSLAPPTNRRFYAHTGGTRKIGRLTNSARILKEHFEALFNETASSALPIRRISIGFGGLLPEKYATTTLFDDIEAENKERRRQEAIIAVRQKFGKNAMLKGISLQEKATARERNNQIGGHRA